MSMQLQKVLILLLVCCFLPWEGAGQYHLERIFKNSTKNPSTEEVDQFRKAPLLIIKSDLPVFKKKKKKPAEKLQYEANTKKMIREYNAVVDSFASKYYPYNKKIVVKSEAEAEKLFKDSKSRKEYAVMRLSGDKYLSFKLSSQKKGLFLVKIPTDTSGVFEPSEANFSFCFQRLENYFKRIDAGSSYRMKVYRKLMGQMQERLKNDLPKKTLLINKRDLDEELSESSISEFYPKKIALVEKSFIDSIILKKDSGFYYLKVIPYTGSYSREGLTLHTAFHYIIDPTDGAAFFFSWNLPQKITPYALKKYTGILTERNYLK